MSEDQNRPNKFAEPQVEPLFVAVPGTDAEFQSAYDAAAATLPKFIEQIQQGGGATYSVKLRFRDPDASARLGEDRIMFLWLTLVHYHPAERLFSGAFFEVPPEFQKWHQVGQRVAFPPEDIFDWMVLREGHLHGGFTLRVARSKLPEAELEAHDRYIGVSVYEPLPI
jgi:uncharacterized protein YegJ (DUF2314 family)